MNCPVCNVALTMTERQGVEIDYCHKCRGVWLDRGELDKIIERSSGSGGGYPRDKKYDERERERYSDERYSDRERYDSSHSHKKHKKREGFLSDLFDFD